jgi:hypothetical protein
MLANQRRIRNDIDVLIYQFADVLMAGKILKDVSKPEERRSINVPIANLQM